MGVLWHNTVLHDSWGPVTWNSGAWLVWSCDTTQWCMVGGGLVTQHSVAWIRGGPVTWKTVVHGWFGPVTPHSGVWLMGVLWHNTVLHGWWGPVTKVTKHNSAARLVGVTQELWFMKWASSGTKQLCVVGKGPTTQYSPGAWLVRAYDTTQSWCMVGEGPTTQHSPGAWLVRVLRHNTVLVHGWWGSYDTTQSWCMVGEGPTTQHSPGAWLVRVLRHNTVLVHGWWGSYDTTQSWCVVGEGLRHNTVLVHGWWGSYDTTQSWCMVGEGPTTQHSPGAWLVRVLRHNTVLVHDWWASHDTIHGSWAIGAHVIKQSRANLLVVLWRKTVVPE